MSGSNKIIVSENALKGESLQQLNKELLNANVEAVSDEGGEYEMKSKKK